MHVLWKMAVLLKLADLLLLLLITEMTSASGYHCVNLGPMDIMNCTSGSPRIRISKDANRYLLSLCSNSTCIGNWRTIRCSEICQICRSLLGSSSKSAMHVFLVFMHTFFLLISIGCGIVDSRCETQVDMFFNKYCEGVKLPTNNKNNMLVTPTSSLTSQKVTVSVFKF